MYQIRALQCTKSLLYVCVAHPFSHGSFVRVLCCWKERCEADGVDDAPSLHRRAVCSKLALSNVAPLPASLVMDPYELFSASLVW